MIDIEFRLCKTGSYSPWHLDIADEYNVNLMITSDIGKFVKIGDDIYKVQTIDWYKFYKHIATLEDMNSKGEITDEEFMGEINDIVNNKEKDFHLEKCKPLEEFKKTIIELSKKQKEK